MLLTQKPVPIAFPNHHRRSSTAAPIVHAHPTPGLLTLTHPQRRLQQRPHSPRLSRRSLQRTQISVAPPPARPRGRSNERPKTATAATPNPTSAAAPPALAPAAPETSPSPLAPRLNPPSGRLARRRTRHKSTPTANLMMEPPTHMPIERSSSDPTPLAKSALAPSAPIAVPRAPSSADVGASVLSRSDPLQKLRIHPELGHSAAHADAANNGHNQRAPRREKRRRNRSKHLTAQAGLPLAEWDFTPEAPSDEEEDAEPSTPVEQTGVQDISWNRAFLDNGPKTAPIAITTSASPFTSSPSPVATLPPFQFPARAGPPSTPPRKARPENPRTPSSARKAPNASAEGVFQFSDEEDATTRSSPPSSVRKHAKRQSNADLAKQLFASSSFQLAPEPVALPKPTFLSLVSPVRA